MLSIPDQKVLDIGTGSGLLATMAADVLKQSNTSLNKGTVFLKHIKLYHV